MTQFGFHIGQQHMSMADMRGLFRTLDEARVDWISLWDHIYETPPSGGTGDHFETVASLAALAMDTRHARVSCLVFYVGYRNPALIAKAASTLDHLSDGRFELGLGAGWHEWEAEAYGYDFPGVGERISMLQEAVPLVRSLLTEPRTTFNGKYFRTENASCLPAPVQERLPIWIGGIGEKRTLRLAAKHADGWNAAYVSADEFARLNGVLDDWCEVERREPSEIERSVNLLFCMGASEADLEGEQARLQEQWGPMTQRVSHGALLATPDTALDHIAAYVDAGADL
ncbi:MAG: LLM class flavin-dependent oxidoreductase, partial [Acidimicrobiales bacterium]